MGHSARYQDSNYRTKPQRELTWGAILSHTFALYLAELPKLILPFLIAGVIVGSLNDVVERAISANPPAEIVRYVALRLLSSVGGWVIGTVNAAFPVCPLCLSMDFHEEPQSESEPVVGRTFHAVVACGNCHAKWHVEEFAAWYTTLLDAGDNPHDLSVQTGQSRPLTFWEKYAQWLRAGQLR